MMFDLKNRRPDLVDHGKKEIVLRSRGKINFKYDKLNSDVYVKSPYIRGNVYWKQLPPNIQYAETKLEFKRLLTDDVLLKLKC